MCIKCNEKISRIYSLSVLIIIAVGFSSCSWVYRSNTLFFPVFEKKGDMVIESSVGSSDLSINAGYAITDGFAVTAGYQNRSDNEPSPGNFFSELGLAWYKKPNTHFSYELMGSTGYGQYEIFKSTSFFFSNYNSDQFIKTNYLRNNLQFNLNYSYKPFTFSLGSRLSYVHFNEFDDLTLRSDTKQVLTHYTGQNFGHVYFEPVMAVSLNIKRFSFFTQTGYLLLLRGTLDYFIYDPYVINWGVKFRFNTHAINRINKNEK
jgi:hypothetical protein